MRRKRRAQNQRSGTRQRDRRAGCADQEAREHEEHVHAHVAGLDQLLGVLHGGAQASDRHVRPSTKQHGDPAQAVERGDVSPAGHVAGTFLPAARRNSRARWG